MTNTEDLISRLAGYRPDDVHLDAEWDRAGVRSHVLATERNRGRRFGSHRVSPTLLSAAAVSALLLAGVAVVVLPGSDAGTPSGGHRAPFAATDVVGTPRVGAGQFGYREVKNYRGDASTVLGSTRVWDAPDGSQYFEYIDSNPDDAPGLRGTTCGHRPAPVDPSLAHPTQAVFDAMPTDPDALEGWLRDRVQGSTSQDEAVFVSIGTALRELDPLANSQLRVAWVNVLSRIPRVTVHADATDYLGRPAVRVDFTDHANRPGEVSSLFFDPGTFELVEEADALNTQPIDPAPSPAYDAQLSEPPTAEAIQYENVRMVTAEQVVDAVPADVLQCVADSN